MGHILDEMLARLDPLSGRQDRVEDVLCRWLALERRQLALLGT